MIAPQRVLIIGGYGEFGGRLARLLLRDGHEVIVAGRSLKKAEQFCSEHGGLAVQLDIQNDLHLIAVQNANVVVDAAGPYQAYGKNNTPYRVAKAALDCGAHYLDLSDDGHFSKGIATLDAHAKSKNLVALSGASTTPAISGAAVTQMQTGLSGIEKIETSILPGSRAPQGRSVMLAILEQVGNPIAFWRNEQWVTHAGWSNPVKKRISQSIARNANLIMAADAVLFPEHFKARSVLFRAGLAVPVMNSALHWLGVMRTHSLLPNLTTFVRPLQWLASCITPFGKDTGGMSVDVIGVAASNDEVNKSIRHKTWQLSAAPGEGPNVPAVPARALIRQIDQLETGARVCIDELGLEHYTNAMSDLGITTEAHEKEFTYVFQQSLSTDWQQLPAKIQDTHKVIDQRVLHGVSKITRGTSPLTQLIALMFRFPPAADDATVTVTKTRDEKKEIWIRDFAGKRFKSTLRNLPSSASSDGKRIIEEQFGLLKFKLHLNIVENAMRYDVLRGSCLGVPIPNRLLPISNTREFVEDGKMHFCVELLAPFKLGLIVRYEGWLK